MIKTEDIMNALRNKMFMTIQAENNHLVAEFQAKLGGYELCRELLKLQIKDVTTIDMTQLHKMHTKAYRKYLELLTNL